MASLYTVPPPITNTLDTLPLTGPIESMFNASSNVLATSTSSGNANSSRMVSLLDNTTFKRLSSGRNFLGIDSYVFLPIITAFCKVLPDALLVAATETGLASTVLVSSLKKAMSPGKRHGRPPDFPMPQVVRVAATTISKLFVMSIFSTV